MANNAMMYDDVVKMHLRDVKRFPLLSPEEETEVALKAKQGDKAARDRILTSNMRFVIKIAAKYRNRGLDFEDLISEGYIGLIKALDHFEPSKGWHFISYAVWWIRQNISKAIIDTGHTIRLPVNRDAEVRDINKLRRKVNMDGAKTEEQELEEVASMLGMTKHHVREMMNISREMISLETPLGADTENTVMDTIPSQFLTPEEQYLDLEMKNSISSAMSVLDPKAQKVISLRYGLGGLGEHTLKEAGEKMNLSRERVRQIEKKAMQTLSDYIPSETSLREYIA
ncbi:MAG: RNA polymerase sigma factor RpoD/SigA [Treponema sp.]|nr:RNA polymerase sigma factor RpoD/SigA [Treponema sp.]